MNSDNVDSKGICINCGADTGSAAQALCDDCAGKGVQVCRHCGKRPANGTTPYCNQCAEEILGTA